MTISKVLGAESAALPFQPSELDDVKELNLLEYFLQLSFHTSDLHVTRALSLCSREEDLYFINSNIEALDGSVVSVWMDFNRMEPPQSYEDCLSGGTLKIDPVVQLYATGCIEPPLGFKGNPTGQFRMMLFRVALGKCLVHHQGRETFMSAEIPQGIDSLELCENPEPRFYQSLYRISSSKQVLPCAIVEFEFRPVKIDVPEPVCEICEAAPAQLYCPSDKAHFCEACDTRHHSTTTIFSRHVRIPCAKSPVQFGVCEYHPSEIVDLVCTECCIPLCSHCITIGNHSDVSFLNHPLMSTFDAYDYSLKNALEHDEFLVTRLERLTFRIKDRHGILSQIYANFNHAKKQVDTSRNLFVKDLELMQRKKLQYLEALEDEIECQEAQMEWLEQHLRHLLLTLGHADFCNVKKKYDLAIEHMFGSAIPISLDAMPKWVLQNLELVGDATVSYISLDMGHLNIDKETADKHPLGNSSSYYEDVAPCWKPVAVFDDWDETLGHCPDERVGVDLGARLETVLSKHSQRPRRPRRIRRGDLYPGFEKDDFGDYKDGSYDDEEDTCDAETIDNYEASPNDFGHYKGVPFANASALETSEKRYSCDGNFTLARLRVERLWQLVSDGYMITLLTFIKLVAPPERSDVISKACILASYFDEFDLLLTKALDYEKAAISSQGGFCILMRSSACIFDLLTFVCFQGASKDVTLWFNTNVYNKVATSLLALTNPAGDAGEANGNDTDAKSRAFSCAMDITASLVLIADAVGIPSTIRAILHRLCDAVPPNVAPILCIDFLAQITSRFILEHAKFDDVVLSQQYLTEFKVHLGYHLSRIGIVAWELAYPIATGTSTSEVGERNDHLEVAKSLQQWLEVLFRRPRLVSKIHTRQFSMVPDLVEAAQYILDAVEKLQAAHSAGTLDAPMQLQNSLSSPKYKFLELFKLAATRHE